MRDVSIGQNGMVAEVAAWRAQRRDEWRELRKPARAHLGLQIDEYRKSTPPIAQGQFAGLSISNPFDAEISFPRVKTQTETAHLNKNADQGIGVPRNRANDEGCEASEVVGLCARPGNFGGISCLQFSERFHDY